LSLKTYFINKINIGRLIPPLFAVESLNKLKFFELTTKRVS